MKAASLILFTSFLFSMGINAQNSEKKTVEFPKSFILGKQDFLKSLIFISPKYFRENGIEINSNPGLTKEKENIILLAQNFNAEEINQVYFEMYADKKSPVTEGAFIVVVEFNSEDLLKKNTRVVKEIGLFYPSYFTTGRYAIIIGCENRELLEKMSSFYINNVGAKYLYPNK